jgi:hypothetical protein
VYELKEGMVVIVCMEILHDEIGLSRMEMMAQVVRVDPAYVVFKTQGPGTDLVLLRDMFGDIVDVLRQKVEVYESLGKSGFAPAC